MKKLVTAIVALGLFTWWGSGLLRPAKFEAPLSQSVMPTPKIEVTPESDLAYKSGKLLYEVYQLEEKSNLKLMANFFSGLRAKEILAANSCNFMTSGGFYNQEREPIGFFKAEGMFNQNQANRLFNGYLVRTDNGWQIREILPQKVEAGIQTGPILIRNKQIVQLTLDQDEQRRRIIAWENSKKQIGFAALYDPQTIFGGPNLTDLGELVMKIAEREGLVIETAINLDGGSASFFYVRDKIFLQDFEAAGSYFCETELK